MRISSFAFLGSFAFFAVAISKANENLESRDFHSEKYLANSQKEYLTLPQKVTLKVEQSDIDSVDLGPWSLDEKIGQLLLIGYRSHEQVFRIQPAGLVFFSWSLKDAEQTQSLITEIQEVHEKKEKAPLFLATDHEGGRVLRIKKGITQFPDAAAVGSLRNPEASFAVGRAMGLELSALGFNMNLAPVLDLGNARSFLANRVWGDDPSRVRDSTVPFVQGLFSSRVLGVAKHFPGHGGTSEDSHFSLPKILKSEKELWTQDLLPFQAAVENGVSAVMTAHVEIPSIDRGPASLSKKFITEILREKIGFNGLVITDDLEMGGVAKQLGFTPQDLALKALKAGSDLILIVWSQELQNKVVKRVQLALEKGEITQEWLDIKVKKIVAFKNKFLGNRVFQNPYWKDNLRRKENLDLAEKVVDEAIHWNAGNEKLLLENFDSKLAQSWKVLLPSREWRVKWMSLRPQDKVYVLSKKADSTVIKNYMRDIEEAMRLSVPLVLVTPPRALGSEELFQALRVRLGALIRKKELRSPVLWAHQGATPIKINPKTKRDLPMGILSLHSGSLATLNSLMSRLINEKKESDGYRFSIDTALME